MIFGILLISNHSKEYPINRDDIIRLEACGDNTFIVTGDGKQHVHSLSLGEVEKKLNQKFFRSHNSHIINLRRIKSIQRGRSYLLEMMDGNCVPVSQRKVAEFRRRMDSLQNSTID